MFKGTMKKFGKLERSVRWFRGMSPEQFRACDKLLHALRDDIQQESTYRVRECLTLLGIHPLINAKHIKAIIDISQGSDLAFLWFLWEANYKEPHGPIEEHNNYTTNEQLLLSAIAHLDMASTMRGLDKILPLSEHGKKYQVQEAPKKVKPKKIKSQKSVENANILPYSIKQVRPKRYVSSTVSKPKERKVIFPHYHNYKDQMYNIPNESSRWFTNYELSPAKREVKKCLSIALAQIFAKDRAPPGKLLCHVHRWVEHSTDRKQEELALETLQRCMQLMDVPGAERQKRSKRIVEQLEREVKSAANKLQQYRRCQLTTLRKIRRNAMDCQSCEMCTHLFPMPGMETKQNVDFSFLLPQFSNIPAHPLQYQEAMEEKLGIKVLQWGSEKQYKRINVDDDDQKDTIRGQFEYNSAGIKINCPSNVNKPRIRKSQFIKNDCKVMLLNDKGKVEQTFKSSRKKETSSAEAAEDIKYCFRGNMPDGLLNWDFFKIYETHNNEPTTDMQPLIKSYCIRALNKAMEEQLEMEESPAEKRLTAAEAADKCARRTIEETNKNLDQCMRQQNPTKAERLQTTNIDPDNIPQLIELLKAGMDQLKDNPFYVLVTLPNAHKLPVLLDWIAERYGKTYSYQQMNQLATCSRVVYEQLMKKSEQKEVPLPNNLGEFHGNREFFQCRLNQISVEYYNRLNDMALKQSRLIWLALRGYSGLTGSNPETFFAYMPAKERDFMRHNVWRSKNYRKMDTIRKEMRKRKWTEMW